MLAGLHIQQAGQPTEAKMSSRVGTFFIWIGLGLIGLFVLSDIAREPVCNLLAFGAIFLVLGIGLWLRGPSRPKQETGRFRVLRSAKKKK